MTERVVLKHLNKKETVTTDVTAYKTKNFDYTIFRGDTKRVPSGNVQFSDAIGDVLSIQAFDRLKIYVDDGSQTLMAKALLVPVSDGKDVYVYTLRGPEFLTEKRRASGVHTGKTRTQLFKDLVDEYFPEFTYDGTSIPTVAGEEDIEEQRYNAKMIREIFDFLAEDSNRVWFIDENWKIYLKTNSFTDTGYTITQTEIFGRPDKRFDTSQWQNIVRVEGESVDTVYENTENTVTDIFQTDYSLKFIPSNIELRLVGSGEQWEDVSPLRGAYAGTRRADDDGIQYLVLPAEKKIRFITPQDLVAVNDTLWFRFTLTDQVVSEQINPTSYQKYGAITGPPEVNRLVTTQAQADELALTLGEVRGEPKRFFEFPTVWNTNIIPGGKITFNAEGVNDLYNVVQLRIEETDTAPKFVLTLNNINYQAEDALKDITNRLRQLEEKQSQNSSFVKKTIPVFGNLGIDIHGVRVKESEIGNAFTFDVTDVSGMFDNSSRYLDGVDGSGSLTGAGWLEVASAFGLIKDFLWDDFEWDLDNSTATLDTSTRSISFTGSQVMLSEVKEYRSGEEITQVRLNKIGRSSNTATISVRTSSDGSTWNAWEDLTQGDVLTLSNSGEYLQMRVSGTDETFYSEDTDGLPVGIEIEVIATT